MTFCRLSEQSKETSRCLGLSSGQAVISLQSFNVMNPHRSPKSYLRVDSQGQVNICTYLELNCGHAPAKLSFPCCDSTVKLDTRRRSSIRQARICKYFKKQPCSHARSFLSLPQDIRFKIYNEAGLWCGHDVKHGTEIDLSSSASVWKGMPPYSSDTQDFSTAHSLLLTCRAMYIEVAMNLYRGSKFFIFYKVDATGLGPIRSLRTTSLYWLSVLTIHLNVTSCGMGVHSTVTHPDDDVYNSHNYLHKGSLSIDFSPPNQSYYEHQRAAHAVEEWRVTAHYMLSHIELEKLKFQFVCDVQDSHTARKVLEPLQNLRKPLKECSIRLNQLQDPVLQNLAYRTATKAMGYQPQEASQPFRFFDLPWEVRQNILLLTDLVTPLNEVYWVHTQGFGVRYATPGCREYYRECQDSSRDPCGLHGVCRFRHCWRRMPSEWSCFCRLYHAAYTPNCQCWRPPRALFLVSRLMRDEALAVFFSSNRFVIELLPHDPLEDPDPIEDDDPVGALLEKPFSFRLVLFLQETIPRQALGYLRYLELVINPLISSGEVAELDEDGLSDWTITIEDILNQECSVHLLTLRVYMGDFRNYGSDYGPGELRSMTKDRAMAMLRTYRRFVQPLQRLGLRRFACGNKCDRTWKLGEKREKDHKEGEEKEEEEEAKENVENISRQGLSDTRLDRFFVHVSWPWRYHPVWKPETTRIEAARMSFERSLERTVMRDDSYDSTRLGKESIPISEWLKKLSADPFSA